MSLKMNFFFSLFPSGFHSQSAASSTASYLSKPTLSYLFSSDAFVLIAFRLHQNPDAAAFFFFRQDVMYDTGK